jgi:hypothetical protein
MPNVPPKRLFLSNELLSTPIKEVPLISNTTEPFVNPPPPPVLTVLAGLE